MVAREGDIARRDSALHEVKAVLQEVDEERPRASSSPPWENCADMVLGFQAVSTHAAGRGERSGQIGTNAGLQLNVGSVRAVDIPRTAKRSAIVMRMQLAEERPPALASRRRRHAPNRADARAAKCPSVTRRIDSD